MMQNRRIFVSTAVFLLLSASSILQPGSAQEAGNFFAGKQIRIIVGTDAGGGYDTYARLVGRQLGQHIPGKPTFIVENMPGASGIKAVNYLYSGVPNDGTVLATFNNAIPFYQAIRQPGISFKSEELSWVGSLTQTASVLAVWHGTGVKTVDDATKKEVIIGATGAAGTKAAYPQLLNKTLGTKFKIVAGYAGSKTVLLAIERGEVEGDGSNPWSTWHAAKPDWVKEGKIVPLVQIGLKKEADLPNVPLLTDLATNDEQRAIFAFVAAPVAMQQPFAGPPGMPPERLAILRRGFEQMVRDPAFRAEVEALKLDLDPLPGEQVEKIVRSVVGTPPAVIQKAQAAMEVKDAAQAPASGGAKTGSE